MEVNLPVSWRQISQSDQISFSSINLPNKHSRLWEIIQCAKLYYMSKKGKHFCNNMWPFDEGMHLWAKYATDEFWKCCGHLEKEKKQVPLCKKVNYKHIYVCVKYTTKISIVFSFICLGPSFQKMTPHILLHGSLGPTTLEKNLKHCPC